MLEELVRKNRSYRRFYQDEPVDIETLRALVTLARHTPSAANRQPLKYVLSCDPETNARIFPYLSWAGYLKDWKGPGEGERPAAYVVVLGDTQISRKIDCDHGIASQTMLLGAAERGLGGCIFGAVDRRGLSRELGIPERYEIKLVIALGRPKETVVIEDVGADGDIKYYRDADGVHHVPKRTLDELIFQEHKTGL